MWKRKLHYLFKNWHFFVQNHMFSSTEFLNTRFFVKNFHSCLIQILDGSFFLIIYDSRSPPGPRQLQRHLEKADGEAAVRLRRDPQAELLVHRPRVLTHQSAGAPLL